MQSFSLSVCARANTHTHTHQEYKKWPVSNLKRELVRRGIAHGHCIEKTELIELLDADDEKHGTKVVCTWNHCACHTHTTSV